MRTLLLALCALAAGCGRAPEPLTPEQALAKLPEKLPSLALVSLTENSGYHRGTYGPVDEPARLQELRDRAAAPTVMSSRRVLPDLLVSVKVCASPEAAQKEMEDSLRRRSVHFTPEATPRGEVYYYLDNHAVFVVGDKLVEVMRQQSPDLELVRSGVAAMQDLLAPPPIPGPQFFGQPLW